VSNGVLIADEIDDVRSGAANEPRHDGEHAAGCVSRRIRGNSETAQLKPAPLRQTPSDRIAPNSDGVDRSAVMRGITEVRLILDESGSEARQARVPDFIQRLRVNEFDRFEAELCRPELCNPSPLPVFSYGIVLLCN